MKHDYEFSVGENINGYNVGNILYCKIEFRTDDIWGRPHFIAENDKFIITHIDSNFNYIEMISTKFVNINYTIRIGVVGLKKFTGLKELRREKIKIIENDS